MNRLRLFAYQAVLVCSAFGVLTACSGTNFATQKATEASLAPVAPTLPVGSTPDNSGSQVDKSGWTSTCGSIDGVAGGKYCLYQNSPEPKYTLWFFHGLLDSPLVFNETSARYESYQGLKAGLGPVQIISVSFGTSWLLTGYPNRTLDPANATLDTFYKQIVPFVENTLHVKKPYMLMGHSMGGFNTATLCAAFPDMWEKCTLLNAMLPTCDPYALIPTCNPGPGLVVRYNFTADTWKTTQPLMLLKQTTRLPKSFVTVCKNDEWGLFDGPKAWHDQAVAQGFDSRWVPIMDSCDHEHWPYQEVLKFLSEP